MSLRTLLIWIIIAGALGSGVLVTRSRQRAALLIIPEATSRTVGFEPSSVVGIERIVDDHREILERDPDAISQWVIHWSQGGMDHRWGVQSRKVRSGLRSLATSRIQLSETDLVETLAGEIVIRLGSGDSIRLLFGDSSSGGYIPIRVEERAVDGVATKLWFGRVERAISDAFISNRLLGWRSDRLFEMVNSAVDRVELVAGGTSVEFARTSAGWVVVDPIQIHGNTERIEDLVKVLISLEAVSFVDQALDETTTGISSPIATIRMHAGGIESSLVIGTRADVGGSSVYGQLETSTGSALITLKTDQLSKVNSSVEAYIGSTPSSASATQVRKVQINGRDGNARLVADRSTGSWIIDGAQADSLNREAIERMINVLINHPTQTIRVLDEDSAIVPFGSVELIGQGDRLMDRLSIALDSTPSGMRLLVIRELVSGQRVLWAIANDEAAATGAWLTVVAGKRLP